MDWGMENRLNQLMPKGKCFFMPIDHGYFQGPTSGLEKPGETIKPLIPYFDALFCTRGVLRSAIDFRGKSPSSTRGKGYSRSWEVEVGPAVPYLIPRLIKLKGIQAVISRFTLSVGYHLFFMAWR